MRQRFMRSAIPRSLHTRLGPSKAERLHHNSYGPLKSLSFLNRYASTTAAGPTRDVLVAAKNSDLIFPDSLRKTVDAHRVANKAALIRKIPREDEHRARTIRRPKIHYARAPTDEAPIGRLEGKEENTKPSLRRRPRKSLKFDYEGEYQTPIPPWNFQMGKHPFPTSPVPWMGLLSAEQLVARDAVERLSAEINAFASFVSPNALEAETFKRVYTEFLQYAEISTEQACLMGSQETGLARLTSDVDVNIGGAARIEQVKLGERGPSPGRPKAQRKNKNVLRQVMKKLAQPSSPFQAFFIDAKIPIIKCSHKRTGIDLEVQSTQDSTAAIEYMKDYLQEFPTLRPLSLVFKHALHMRGLGKSSSHGLNSYATCNMLVASLKFNAARYDRLDSGSHLLEFLKFFSTFNFYENGISLEPLEIFTKGALSKNARHHGLPDTSSLDYHLQCRRLIEGPDRERPYLMCLQDPANLSNDLGKLAFRIKHIQATYAHMIEKLERIMDTYHSLTDSRRGRLSLLNPLVAGDYFSFLQCRRALAAGRSMKGLEAKQPLTKVRKTEAPTLHQDHRK